MLLTSTPRDGASRKLLPSKNGWYLGTFDSQLMIIETFIKSKRGIHELWDIHIDNMVNGLQEQFLEML